MTKGEQTRRKIVTEAAPVFNQHGYEGSSLSHLMAATGLKKGGIYRHFSSKEELAAEAFDYMWTEALRERMERIDENASGVDQLKQLIENFVHYRLPFKGGCPILNTAIDADDGNPVLRDRVRKALKMWLGRIQAVVKAAAQRREIHGDVDPKTVAALILSALEGGLMISRLERNNDALRRVQQHLNWYLDTQVAIHEY
jgi:TetR/AcrR family transcriptional repressor of nem operon